MATAKTEKTVKAIRVTTKRDGFRRGGYEWNGTTCVALSALSDEQVKQLQAESMLVVAECDVSEDELTPLN